MMEKPMPGQIYRRKRTDTIEYVVLLSSDCLDTWLCACFQEASNMAVMGAQVRFVHTDDIIHGIYHKYAGHILTGIK